MQYFIPGFIFYILISISCSQADAPKNETTITNNKTEAGEIKTTILNFYKWYSENEEQVHHFKLFKGQQKEDVPPFVIDWKEAENYFSFLRKSVPYINEKFIQNEKKHFLKSDSLFKLFPEDEIPTGFDYDRITLSQEGPEWLMEELKKDKNTWEITVNGLNATVVVYSEEKSVTDKSDSYRLICLILKKEKTDWKISKIGCDFVEDKYLQ